MPETPQPVAHHVFHRGVLVTTFSAELPAVEGLLRDLVERYDRPPGNFEGVG